ncbi:hypothetical protein MNEG_5003 [Monoraphidium neglectum]|uniref:Uncharacterized protein n=1 Tax=Monoraphidium neglectum TaxID=145388 RepID=A0A0D2MR91_9CHLO|nr:hypothetical protein MNEG_5003 [Monoraphidium neglectum]KIZ02957.1 hypothetical protein MNEG_5003 [Monoraphidium neglectum]|eukprot:XP_013901976.1 hypothetical protein MNEG_5003 [Monoraphidium neglectum]
MLYPMAFSKKEAQVCARYSFVCETGDTACTPAEQKSRARRWSYVPLAKSTCDTLGKVPGIKNLLCCATDKCNKPDPKLDPATKVSNVLIGR